MRKDRKISLPRYKIAYSLCFFVLISLVRGITGTAEIGITLAVYTGALAAVFFADTCEMERREKRWEIFWLFPQRQRIRAIMRRIFWQWLYLCLAPFSGYWLFFWQKPLCGTFEEEAGQYLMYLAAVSVSILFFGILSMTLTNLLGSVWAGIGICVFVWLFLSSKGGEVLLGNWNPLAFQNRNFQAPGDFGWMLGEAAALALTGIMLAALPQTMKKGVRG